MFCGEKSACVALVVTAVCSRTCSIYTVCISFFPYLISNVDSVQNLFAHAFHIAAFLVQRLIIYSRRKLERMAQPVTERVERTVESFERLVEASAAARESVICVDDLEDLLLKKEDQLAPEVAKIRQALTLLRSVSDALFAARSEVKRDLQAATEG